MLKSSLLPIDSSMTVIDHGISPMHRGILLVRDYLGTIMYHEVLKAPESEINVSHIRSGMYQVELIKDGIKSLQYIYKK